MLLAGLVPLGVLVHLLVAPFTKVEESFNLQATHDILAYGMPLRNASTLLQAQYDHLTFPGAVPRSFVGAVVLAGISQPLVALVGATYAQLAVRLVLGGFNAAALVFFGRNVARAFGRPTGCWYAVLQAAQFHVCFYASRTLPNMFAFGLTTFAFANLLPVAPQSRITGAQIAALVRGRQRVALSLLVFAAVVFRAEVALLLLTTIATLLLTRRATLMQLVPGCAVAGMLALTISVPIDSYFWPQGRVMWPELEGFWFNAVRGKASEWGTQPAAWYFMSALPRLLLVSFPLAIVQLLAAVRPGDIAARRAALPLAAPSLAFVALYSLQPHKEARFIFYVIPPLTAVAALGANRLWATATATAAAASKPSSPSSSSTRRVSRLAALATVVLLPLAVLLSAAASGAMLVVSSLNYPGGEAMDELGDFIRGELASSSSLLAASTDASAPAIHHSASSPIYVHADVLPCMTGISLFGFDALSISLLNANYSHWQSSQKQRPAIVLDRTEKLWEKLRPGFWERFDWVLASAEPANAGQVRRLLGVPATPPPTQPQPQRELRPAANDALFDVVGVVEGLDSGSELLRGWTAAELLVSGGGGGGGEAIDSKSKRSKLNVANREGEKHSKKTQKKIVYGTSVPVLGRSGMAVRMTKKWVRNITGGWWLGPRMADKVYILRRRRLEAPIGGESQVG